MNFVAIVILLLSSGAHSEFKVPFQVSIRLKDLYQEKQQDIRYHICNGIIIHEKYILTTASCLQLAIVNTNLSRLLMPGEINVVTIAEHSNGSGLERNVVSIIPHNKFNKLDYDNDIAVLKLDRTLPLAVNSELKWLDIFNGTLSNQSQSCFSTIFNYSVPRNGHTSFYSQVRNLSLLQHWICDDALGDIKPVRSMDLCMEYWFPSTVFCNVSSISLKYSSERGTAYICNNKLVGILADINHPKNVDKCFQNRRTTAFYTNVTMHLEWILKETGIYNLGIKNRNDSVAVQGWTELPVTQVPAKKSAACKNAISTFSLLIISFTFL